jgi:hypothetical protein
MRLLVCCARRRMTPERLAEIRAILRADLDWGLLIPLAVRHKMLPLLWWHLKPEKESIPADTALLLERSFIENAGRMLQLSAELLALGRLFSSHGIPLVPYKGPALGAYLYGNLALRQAGDLDIVVKRLDMSRARVLLIERGYRPRHALSQGGEEFMVRSRYSEVFERTDGPTVELHWAFTNGDVGLTLDLEVLEPRLHTVQFGGGGIAMFSREDLLLILCIHGGKHRWDRLEWLCGVGELLRLSSGELDWLGVVDRAAALGARRMLLLGVLLAHDLLGAPARDDVLRLARSDGTVARLAQEVPKLLVARAGAGEDAGNLATDLFRLHLRERTRDRLRFIWYRVTTPSRPESWAAVSVGKHSFPVHGILRPFRVISKLPLALRQYLLASRGRK